MDKTTNNNKSRVCITSPERIHMPEGTKTKLQKKVVFFGTVNDRREALMRYFPPSILKSAVGRLSITKALVQIDAEGDKLPF